MTTTRTRRTGTGYKAVATWVTQQWLGKPDSHPDVAAVDPAGPGRRRGELPWEISKSALKATVLVTVRDGHGEVSRGRSSRQRLYAEGRLPCCWMAKGRII